MALHLWACGRSRGEGQTPSSVTRGSAWDSGQPWVTWSHAAHTEDDGCDKTGQWVLQNCCVHSVNP